MVHLLTVRSGFQARVVAARLGSEGIVTELRGGISSPYPVGDVGVYVGEGDLDLSRQLLLADEVEDAFFEEDDEAATSPRRRPLVPAWVVVAVLSLLWAVSLLVRWT